MLIEFRRLDGTVLASAEIKREWGPLNFEIISAILPARARAYTLDSLVYFTLSVRVILEKLHENASAGDVLVIPYTNSIAIVLEPVKKLRFKSTLIGKVVGDMEKLRSVRKGEMIIISKAKPRRKTEV